MEPTRNQSIQCSRHRTSTVGGGFRFRERCGTSFHTASSCTAVIVHRIVGAVLGVRVTAILSEPGSWTCRLRPRVLLKNTALPDERLLAVDVHRYHTGVVARFP